MRTAESVIMKWKLQMYTNGKKWIGVDLDGTLAHDEGFVGFEYIGNPIPEMVERVKFWLSIGKDVRIFTARVSEPSDGKINEFYNPAKAVVWIDKWCINVFGRTLPVTNIKDADCEQIWDDKAIGVLKNTGKRLDHI